MLEVAGHAGVGDRDEAEALVLDLVLEVLRDDDLDAVGNLAGAGWVCHGWLLLLVTDGGFRRPERAPSTLTRKPQRFATAFCSSVETRVMKAAAQSASTTFDHARLRHSRGMRSVFSSQSRVIERNGMKNAPSTP